MPSAWTISTQAPHPTERIGGGGMRRRNIFPDPECAGMMHPYANNGTRSDFVKNEGMMWMRATVTAVGTQQNYAQYSLTEDRVPVEGTYHFRLLAHAEGGDGMARCYVRQPDSTYLPCYAVNIPDGQTIVVERAIGVPAGCGELIVRICPAAVVGATAMMMRLSPPSSWDSIRPERADTLLMESGVRVMDTTKEEARNIVGIRVTVDTKTTVTGMYAVDLDEWPILREAGALVFAADTAPY